MHMGRERQVRPGQDLGQRNAPGCPGVEVASGSYGIGETLHHVVKKRHVLQHSRGEHQIELAQLFVEPAGSSYSDVCWSNHLAHVGIDDCDFGMVTTPISQQSGANCCRQAAVTSSEIKDAKALQ